MQDILESEGEKTYHSVMANGLLRDSKTKKWTAEDQEDLSGHLKERKPGEDNPLQKPLKFSKRALKTLNPTDCDLTPEEMIGRTVLMPPAEDGSRHRARIMSKVQDL